jgi:hypothetical protein
MFIEPVSDLTGAFLIGSGNRLITGGTVENQQV